VQNGGINAMTFPMARQYAAPRHRFTHAYPTCSRKSNARAVRQSRTSSIRQRANLTNIANVAASPEGFSILPRGLLKPGPRKHDLRIAKSQGWQARRRRWSWLPV